MSSDSAAPPAGVPVRPLAAAGGRSPPDAPAAPPAAPPLEGELHDEGSARHDRVRVQVWSVEGASKVLGEAAVGLARTRGLVTVGGKLSAVEFSARGTLNVGGATQVEHGLVIDGTGRFSAPVRTGDLSARGTLELKGDLRATGAVLLEGKNELAGGLDAASLTLRGSLRAPGEIRVAGELRAVLTGVSRVGPVRAGLVTIERPRFPPWKRNGTLSTLRIEAREAHLEGVTVEFLRAESIYVGPGCRIARYEGRIVERHRGSTVGPSAVSDHIPPGLWR